MKISFSRLSARQKNSAKRLLKVLFPALGAVAAKVLITKMRREKSFFITAHSRQGVLGFAALSAAAFLGKRWLHVKYLSVDPQFHRRGIGTKILTEIEKNARDRGDSFLFLFSSPWRKSAHALYRKHGFSRFFGFFFWKKIK